MAVLGISPLVGVVSIACPLIAVALALVFRKTVASWLRVRVPQKNERRLESAIVIGAAAAGLFAVAWLLSFVLVDIPIFVTALLYACAALCWIVAWGMCATHDQ